MSNPLRKIRSPRKTTFGKQAELIFRGAVADAIEEHRLAGNSIAVLRSNEVVLLPSEQIEPLSHKKRRMVRINFTTL